MAPGVSGPGAVLRSAASVGAYELVKSLLRRGVSPYECDPNGETPLHAAAYHGRERVCRLLVEYNADSYTKDLFEHSPYDIALSRGHLSVLQVFEPSATANDLTAFSQKASVLPRAAKPLNSDPDPDPDPNTNRNNPNLNPNPGPNHPNPEQVLHQAAANGDVRRAQQCLAEAAEVSEVVNETFANQVAPLHVAALNAHSGVVRLLLDADASPSSRTKRGVRCAHPTSTRLTARHHSPQLR